MLNHWLKRRSHVVLLAICSMLSITSIRSDEIPNCDYSDTVDLSGSQRFNNGSYHFENILIPESLVGTYDYEIQFEGLRVHVPLHQRGCVCHLRPCVKFCCNPTELKVPGVRECSNDLDEELNYSPYVNMTFRNGSQGSVHVLNEFVVQEGIPCAVAYALHDPDKVPWELFENGTLLRLDDGKYLSKQDYCLSPKKVKDSNMYELTPINCATVFEETLSQKLNIIAMMISIPFMVVTILVYLLIPELRNLYGKSLVCYLISMAIGYSVMVINTHTTLSSNDEVCSFLGYSAYYFFVSAFLWLSVMSFHLWYHFGGSRTSAQRYQENRKFAMYCLYAFGLPVILTLLVIVAQLSDLDDAYKPGIGADYCWLKPEDWSSMIYFYGPILAILAFNTTLFVLTWQKVVNVQREVERLAAEGEGTKNLVSQRDMFWLFLRLFIAMGVTWLLEVISYMVGTSNSWSYMFVLTDLCNAALGVIIFALFVLRRKVRKLILKRMKDEAGLKSSSSGSNTSSAISCSTTELSLNINGNSLLTLIH